MTEIKIPKNDFKPNIIILEKYIITINKNLITLYDLNGTIFDTFNFVIIEKFDNLFKIDNYCFIVTDNNWLHKINIINDKLSIYKNIKFKEKIIDCLILNNKLIVLSFLSNVKIFDIYSSFIKVTKPIQTINNTKQSKLFKWDEDLFMIHNSSSISLYKKILGTKPYHLISIIRISKIDKFSYYSLLKLDNKTLFISNHNNTYLIDIKKLKINQNISLFNELNNIKFIYKFENDVYIYSNNNIFMFNYIKNTLIKLIEKDELDAFNILLNLSVHKNYTNLNKNLIINCIENENKNTNTNSNKEFYAFYGIYQNWNMDSFRKPSPYFNYREYFYPQLFDEKEKCTPPYEKRFFNLYKKNKSKYEKKEIKNNPKYKKNYR